MKEVLGDNQLTDREQEAIQFFVKRLEAKFGDRILSIRMFGSRVRGEAGPDWDIELLASPV